MPGTQARRASPVLIVLGCLAGLAGAVQLGRYAVARATSPAGPEKPPWRYANEQSWIVGETLTAIAAVGEHAHGRRGPVVPVDVVERRPPPAGVAAFTIDHGGTLLSFPEHVFAPDAYLPWAAARLGAPAGEPGATDPTLPLRLSDDRLDSLYRASVDTSTALTRAPRSPGAHADAALVLAALAFREAAAGNTDSRHEMVRITAHLAMAQALRGSAPEPASARLAHLTLLMLAGRMADVVARLDALPATADAGEVTWRRALRMRATGDWRAYAWKDAASLLEKLAWARAYRRAIDSDRWYTLVGTLPEDEQALPDWGRITLQGFPTVQDCHAYASEEAAGYDIGEALRAAELFRAQPVSPDAIVAALNEEASPGGFVASGSAARLDVLDWGRLAAFVQRHLAARLAYGWHCSEHIFGLHEDTPRLLAQQEAVYGRLRLFPLEAQRVTRTVADYERFSRPGLDLVRQRPELVTPHLWNLLRTVPAFVTTPPAVPDPAAWFYPPSPAGTAFDDGHGDVRLGYHPPPSEMAGYVRLNPYNTSFLWRDVQTRFGRHATYAALLEAYGPTAEWHLGAMNALAGAAVQGSADHKRWLQKRCETDVDTCSDLGRLLVDAGDAAAAADVYLRYWKEAADRVRVSNSVRWLVEHLETHGRQAEAFEVASDAAGTASADGLTTLAWLREKRGQWREAEALQKENAQHYDNPKELYEFYTRGIASGQKRYTKARDELVAEAFPRGRQKIGATPSGPPTSGVQISRLEGSAQAAGLARNDVIVALDGIRVENFRQFSIVRMTGTDPKMRFLLYRAGAYKEVEATFKERSIPIWVSDYPTNR